MNDELIVLKPFQYIIECTCPNPEHKLVFNLRKGDSIWVSENRKFVENMGWYVLVTINYEHKVYMNCIDLEEKYRNEIICTYMDLELKMNHLIYKIDESLEKFDQKAFQQFAEKLFELNELKKINVKLK